MMFRLFAPSELQSKPYGELAAGDCFFDESTNAWSLVFELPVVGQSRPAKFVAPLSGDQCLVASPTPDPMLTEGTQVVAFKLQGFFSIKFESDPIATSGEALRSTNKPLVILKDGPAIFSERKDSSFHKPLPGFLLNLKSFECVTVQARQIEMHRPTVVERWSLVFNAEPNRGTVFLQQPPSTP